MKEEQKVSFIHSISAKIMLLTVLAVVMSVLIVASGRKREQRRLSETSVQIIF